MQSMLGNTSSLRCVSALLPFGLAALAGVALPVGSMRASTLVDGVVWDGADPAGYADGFSTRGPSTSSLRKQGSIDN